MSSAVDSINLFSLPTSLCPSPLHIQKNSRRTTFRRRILRKSIPIQHCDVFACSPLDDIIDEIKSDIWQSPLDYVLDLSALDWHKTVKTSPPWITAPLPVSRIPGDQPLTIRKHRHSRSSASHSSMGDPAGRSRNNSHGQTINDTTESMLPTSATTPWPLLDTVTSDCAPVPSLPEGSRRTRRNAQESLEKFNQQAGTQPEAAKPRRPSRLRLFTNGLARLRRTTTTGEIPEDTLPITAASPNTPENASGDEDDEEPSIEAVEAYMRKHARNHTKVNPMIGRMAGRLPSPVGGGQDSSQDESWHDQSTRPTTVRASVRILTQVRILTEEPQDVDVAVEVEGTLHNRSAAPHTTIDVIFVMDNGYYVSKDCLEKAAEAVNGTLRQLQRGDRLALYTTHCTHNAVTGNRPEKHFPLGPLGTDTESVFENLTASVCRHGTQTWDPPRPNPSITDVVLCVATSLDSQDLKKGRTHIILLSPATYVLHGVSKTFPDLYIHRVNPAVLPFRREPELPDTVCFNECCKKVFVSNWNSYQSLPGRLKLIVNNARSKQPVGDITDVSIDIRAREGCEVLECFGSKDISHLRLGQVHTFFARLRLNKSKTRQVDLESVNPVFNSSLDVNGLRQDLVTAVAFGAIKVHVLDVQLYSRNSIHSPNCWNYTETPLIVIQDLGGLAPPVDQSLDLYKRYYFHKFTNLTTKLAAVEIGNTLAKPWEIDEGTEKILERMAKEIRHHERVRRYEYDSRQKLPLCPGPIAPEATHEWLEAIWNKRKTKRRGMTGANEEELTQLMDGVDRLNW